MENVKTPAAPQSDALNAFNRLKVAYRKAPYIDYAARRNTLAAMEEILFDNDEDICAAISQDFGNRSYHETKILEIASTVIGIRHSRKHLKKWMKPQKRHVSILFAGGSNRVIPQAKGVVGIIAPWNYPLQLSLSPLTYAIAAGNRVMVKMASNSQNLCKLLQKLFSEKISEDIITILPGVGANEFSTLPYDHMMFTGSPQVGRTVMSNAAPHLTPVTLELGGKSPVILAEDFNLKKAAARIMYSKLINAGQMCIAPDYMFIPENRLDAFVAEVKSIVQKRYPDMMTEDYTSIINQKAFDRLIAALEDAKLKNAQIIRLMPGDDYTAKERKINPMIIINVNENMTLMQEEIFGPFLPIMTYKSIDEVIGYINRHERPLALYIFSNNRKLCGAIIRNTLSGGVTINDCTMHVAQHDMPFGGIGNSGMGQYHAYEGFAEFSKLQPVFHQARIAISLAPPYDRIIKIIYALVRRIKWLK